MPVKVLKVKELMPRTKQTAITSLPEFLEIKTKLSAGLKTNEAIEVTLLPSKERGKKCLRQNFANRVKDYLKELRIDYKVRAFTRDGMDVIQVADEFQM